jgi:CBS domain-containing protein
MSSVKSLLNSKAPGLWFISPQAKVIEALQLMAEKNVGALPVLDNGHLVGILSERDYARKVALLGKTSLDTAVSDIMIEEVITVTMQHGRDECLALMTTHRMRHLPVVEDGRVVGFLSIGDFVKDALLEQQETIHQLEAYVNG